MATRSRQAPSRHRRPVSSGPSGRVRLGVGIFGLLVLFSMVYIGFNAPNTLPGRSYYTVKVQFNNADNVTPHSSVRMNGRLVGQALNPRIEHGHATVDLQLSTDVRPLRSDTQVLVRPRSLIGVRFIELVPGLRGAPLPEGGTIPARQTAAAVGLDQVLDTLDSKTRLRARAMLTALGGGTLGRGDDVNDALPDTSPALRDVRSIFHELNKRPGATGRLVSGADSFFGALEPVRGPLATSFDPDRRALHALTANPGDLADTLKSAPSALRAASTKLPVVRPLVRELGGFARSATPVLAVLPGGLRSAHRLLRDSPPVLRDVPKTLRTLRNVTPDVLTGLDQLRNALPYVDELAKTTTPIAGTLGPRMCDFRAIFGHWANMLSFGDANANILRFTIFGGGPETLIGDTPVVKKVLDQNPQTTILQNPYPAPCKSGSEGGRNDPGAVLPNDGLPGPNEGVALP